MTGFTMMSEMVTEAERVTNVKRALAEAEKRATELEKGMEIEVERVMIAEAETIRT